MNWFEALSWDGRLLVLGILLVLAAIAVLVHCLRLIRKLPGAEHATPAPPPVEPPAQAVRYAAPEAGIDPKVIAAITAAIAQFSESGKTLVVRSVRKSTPWSRAARTDQVSRF